MFSTATTTGAGPGSRPSSRAAARASASSRSLNSGSTQARATRRAPSAGERETSQSIRRRILDTFEQSTLVEAIAFELERDYGFVAINDERLTAAVNVSRDEEENFLADLDAPEESLDYASILAELQPDDGGRPN